MAFFLKSGLGNRNVALIRDPYNENFNRGIDGGINSLKDLIAWHQQTLDAAIHIRDVYCIGPSSGGFAAMLFGHLLQADIVYAIGPRPAPNGFRQATWRLRKLLAEGNGVTRYRIIYSQANGLDRYHAEMFANCPGVELWPVDHYGDTHNLLTPMLDSGEFAALLPAYP